MGRHNGWPQTGYMTVIFNTEHGGILRSAADPLGDVFAERSSVQLRSNDEPTRDTNYVQKGPKAST